MTTPQQPKSEGAIVGGLVAGKTYRVVVPQKLPLGGSVRGSTQPGLFRVYVPSAYGGRLELETSAGTISVTAPDGQPARDHEGKEVAAGSKVAFELPQLAHGWYGVTVSGAAEYEVRSAFTIEGHSVDRDGSMLVPWHFYYYPFTEIWEQGDSHPSAKYDRRFGTEANAWERRSFWKSLIDSDGRRPGGRDGHSITRAYVDEINAFNEKKGISFRYDYDSCWWWGHCDAAATASALFLPPKANGEFSEEDVKFIASEVTMRGYKLALRFFLGGLQNTSRRHPSHTEIPRDEPGQALDADVGPLFEQTIKVIKHEGAIALVDMRASYVEGQDRSPDVWNQAVYKFRMELRQAEEDAPGKDENELARKIAFKTILYANADKKPSDGDPEANPGSGWERHIDAIVHFKPNGRIALDHPGNNCTRCYWPGNFDAIYLPRYIFKINGLQAGGGSGAGNPKVRYEHLAQLGMKLRGVFGG